MLFLLSPSFFIFPQLHATLYITLALIAGIACQFLAISAPTQVIATLITVIAGLIYKEKYGLTNWLFFLLPLAFCTGSLLCFLQMQSQKNFQHLTLGKTIDIQGVISNIEAIQNPRFKFRVIIELINIKPADEHNWQRGAGSFALYSGTMPKIWVADMIQIKNLEFKEIANQSFKNYLIKEKIVATVFIEDLQATIINRPRFNISRGLFYFRKNLFFELRKKMSRQTFALVSSIFLGNRAAVKKQMDAAKEPFKIWGTSHYLARSGLHLVIFAIIWHFILGLIPISYVIKQIFLIVLILIYALLSWGSVSFERALLMFLVYKICLLWRTPSHYIHLVTFVTLLVLCVNPMQLFFLDFQLSFGITFALAWFNHMQTRKNLAF